MHAVCTLCPCPADIDECATGSHSCEHSCQDSVGSYFCLCDSGYFLNENGHSCEGQGNESPIQIAIEDHRKCLQAFAHSPCLRTQIKWQSLVYSFSVVDVAVY